jgi:hypothetical protein
MLALILVLVVDITVLKVNDLVPKSFIHHHEKLLLFSINSLSCLLVVFLIISYIERSFKKNPLNIKFNIELLYRLSLNSLFVTAILVILLIYQMYNNNYYNISISIFIVTISYGTAAAFLAWLVILIFSWSRSNPNVIVSVFITSIILISFNLIVTAGITDIKLADRSDEIREFIGGAVDLSAGKYLFLNKLHTVTTVTSFVGIWCTTIILLNYYRERSLSSVTYWIALALPLLYFLLNYLYPIFLRSFLLDYLTVDPVTVSLTLTIVLTFSKPIGGLTFAIAFWKISSNLAYEKNIKTYMIICGWGFLLIFAADESGLQTLAPYPPFGLASLSVLILGAFMMLLGVYNSALLVDTNYKLRSTIRKQALESSLLGVIGKPQMQKEVEKTVKKITQLKNQLEKDTQQQIDFDENELRIYLSSLMRGVVDTFDSTSEIFAAKSSGKGLKQIPSEPTDFPGDDPNVVKVDGATAKKDIIGSYFVRGEIKNLGDTALTSVQVYVHFYDDNNQTVGIPAFCYADPSNIEPGHTSTFDTFVMTDQMSGTPKSFRLSFDWD